MADIDFDDYGAIPRFSGDQARRVMNIAGAVSSLALIAGVCVWGYTLAVRDVTGIPIVKAAEGAMRVAPVNPGGDVADHQGMAINAIAELRASETLPEEIVLAPPPVELSLEDGPGISQISAVVEEVAPPVPLTLASASVDAGPSAADPEVEISTDDAIALALAEALGVTDTTTEAAPDLPAGGMASVRPMPRPQRGTVTNITDVSASSAAPVEIDPSTLEIGTRLVQLGAYDTAEDARAEWAVIRDRFGDLLSGKSLVLQTAESGGRTFYRLRAAGFDGEDDARRFCSALLAEDASCIPVAHR